MGYPETWWRPLLWEDGLLGLHTAGGILRSGRDSCWSMGNWDSILLERSVLRWVVGVACLGVLLWIFALATPYWIIEISPPGDR